MDDAQILRALRSLTTASGRLREAVADLDERTAALESRLTEHAGASAARHDEILRAVRSPVQLAAEERAVELLQGRAGVVGWLRRVPSQLADAARWAQRHPVSAGVYLAGLAGIVRAVSVYVPGLGVVASILEALMSALAPSPSTGGAP
jgi:hypothetical protein